MAIIYENYGIEFRFFFGIIGVDRRNNMKEKKVVLITGGGKGIGYGIARAFANEGYDLVITGRTEDTLNQAKVQLETEFSISVLALVADGSKEEEVKRVITAIKSQYGVLHTLINNAQASKSGKRLVEHSKADFDLAVQTGLYGTFFYMREAFPLLKESRGNVINFASGAGLFGKPGQASYAAAKEGIRGLSRVAATEWGPYGIGVNVICPLAMTESLENWKQAYPELYAKTIKDIPMKRFADPETDIGAMCVFLSSEKAGYLTGETITIQGGSGLRP